MATFLRPSRLECAQGTVGYLFNGFMDWEKGRR
jgi:hypothetical protein